MAPAMDTADSLIESLVSLDDESASHVISSVLQRRPDLAPGIVCEAVPDLTYAPARAITERRSRGIVKNYNPNSGYGFIACPELKEVFGGDVWVHKHQIGMCSEGMEVEFAVMLSREHKPQAFDIQPVGQAGGWGAMPYGGAQAPMPMWYDARYEEPPWLGGGKKGWGKGEGKHYSWGMPPSQDWGKGFDNAYGKGDGKGKFGGKSKIGEAEMLMLPRPEHRELLGEFIGQIKSFNHKSEAGFGFIECEDLKSQGYPNDVFLHHSEICNFSVGDDVLFSAYLSPKGQPQAKHLRAPSARGVDGTPPSAKRMRPA